MLRNPTNQQIAECLGFNDAIDQTHVRDVVIVGAGPSGLAAAVYAASEGLDVLVLEIERARRTGRLELEDRELPRLPDRHLRARSSPGAPTRRRRSSAPRCMIAKGATQLDVRPEAVRASRSTTAPRVPARTVIIATGAEYRQARRSRTWRSSKGAGVYYGATFIEAQLCGGEEVIVVGGGNSAGQAAVFLAQTAQARAHARPVGGLADTMSRYLIRRIEENPAIELRTHTEIVALEGDEHLERVRWRDNRTGRHRDARHPPRVRHDRRGAQHRAGSTAASRSTPRDSSRPGPDLSPEDLAAARWPLARPPHLLETSLPGVFAVGDVRGGNIKRVASAVGEGSIAVSFVHQVLHE